MEELKTLSEKKAFLEKLDREKELRERLALEQASFSPFASYVQTVDVVYQGDIIPSFTSMVKEWNGCGCMRLILVGGAAG